ncbi:hypothetical protein D3C86_1779040 [compost metagenome]
MQVDYHFVDGNPHDENLYRLKMVDRAADRNDETFAYSRIRNVRFEGLGNRFAYPNPVNDKLVIKDFTKVLNIRILDMNGKAVLLSEALENGEVNVGKLTAGLHVVEITWTDGDKTAQKILIQK